MSASPGANWKPIAAIAIIALAALVVFNPHGGGSGSQHDAAAKPAKVAGASIGRVK